MLCAWGETSAHVCIGRLGSTPVGEWQAPPQRLSSTGPTSEAKDGGLAGQAAGVSFGQEATPAAADPPPHPAARPTPSNTPASQARLQAHADVGFDTLRCLPATPGSVGIREALTVGMSLPDRAVRRRANGVRKAVPRDRIELSTHGFSVRCSTN